ncbi:hypothetical protein CVT25_008030 [Psilocybe cyanescens]|uniref:Uncharacterized protein n=1 Tax=Psilocybe cyanescens TaxID=93625 RepID=A0A409W815_PSICY|nr:hypothetical protein CVT25_008030 [Psilocybe cyanescens]
MRKGINEANLTQHATIRTQAKPDLNHARITRDLELTPEPDNNNEWIDVESDSPAPEPDLATVELEFIPPPTSRGRPRRYPRRYNDYLPNSTTLLPHMPPPRPIGPPAPK